MENITYSVSIIGDIFSAEISFSYQSKKGVSLEIRLKRRAAIQAQVLTN